MPITIESKRKAAREYVRRVFRNNTANLNKDDIETAIDDLVAFIEANVSAINNAFPEPFKSTATVPQKRLVLALAAIELAGL